MLVGKPDGVNNVNNARIGSWKLQFSESIHDARDHRRIHQGCAIRVHVLDKTGARNIKGDGNYAGQVRLSCPASLVARPEGAEIRPYRGLNLRWM